MVSRHYPAAEHCYNYSLIALYYAELGDTENTLTALEDAARYAVSASHLGEVRYTAPMVNRLVHRPENSTKNYRGNACNLRLKRMEWKAFDFVRDTPRFAEIKAFLEVHAECFPVPAGTFSRFLS